MKTAPSEMAAVVNNDREVYPLTTSGQIKDVDYPFIKQVLCERWLLRNTEYDEWSPR